MFTIRCPYCGERDQSEFSNGGEAHVARPKDPEQISDREWSEYVFIRANPKGIYYERWVHTCLLYTSPSPRDGLLSRMPSSA